MGQRGGQPVELAAGFHLVSGLSSGNACLVISPEPTLFDAGLPGDGPAVLRFLDNLGLAPADLRTIALTHADPGHAGAAPWLRRHTGARILASAEQAAVAAGQSAGYGRALWRTGLRLAGRQPEPFAVDDVLAPGDEVAGFRVLATPGHTPGHLSFFREEDGVLVAGDAVRVSGHDVLAPPFWSSQSEWHARLSISLLADLPVHLLVPGHGTPYREPAKALRRAGGPPGFVEALIRRRETRARRRR